jgi:hypothetical protein
MGNWLGHLFFFHALCVSVSGFQLCCSAPYLTSVDTGGPRLLLLRLRLLTLLLVRPLLRLPRLLLLVLQD